MVVPMVAVVVAMGVRMSGAVGMLMFVLVEHDLQTPAKCVGDPAEGGEVWHMIAALQTRDHRLGHPQAQRELLLRFAGMSAERDQPPRAFGRDSRAVVPRVTVRRLVI
jgi:hypothetical protein